MSRLQQAIRTGLAGRFTGAAGLILGIGLFVTGCATVEGYRQRMDLLVGKTSDQILVEWGAPVQKEPMSDGAEMWIYSRISESRTGGYWSSRQRSRVEVFTDKDGKQSRRTVTYSVPYYEPLVVNHFECETRMVMGPDKRVRSVSFEGNGCLAEEMKKPPEALPEKASEKAPEKAPEKAL